MFKRSVIDQIEIQRDGSIQVRIALEVADGEEVIARSWHRTALPPGFDIDAQMNAVNEHLAVGVGENRAKYPPVPASEIARIKAAGKAFWSTEAVSKYQARQAADEAILRQRAGAK